MPIDLRRIRRIVFSVPVLVVTGLFVLYLAFGFFAVPAIVKWQLEKQVPEKLGQKISVGDVRFNPLALRIEIGDLALSDPAGSPMLGFKRLRVDFELRSVIDRAWTFAEATLEAPSLRLDLDRDGRHNFSALLERLSKDEPEKEAGPLPRLVVRSAAITGGRIEFSDRFLDEPLVVRIEPLRIQIDHLSTLSAEQSHYLLSARTAEGETLEASGELGLNPVASKGRLALNGVKVATLARGLSRLVALESPAGTIDFTTNFDLALDGRGTISGAARDVDLDVAALSANGVGAAGVPLLAIETLSLKQGRVDLDRREATFAGFTAAKGRVAASVDAQGRSDWARLARVSAAPPQDTAASAASPASDPSRGGQGADAPGPGPWRVSVASAEVTDIALRLSDAAQGRSAKVAAVGISASPSAEFGPKGTRVELGQPKLSIAGVRLERGPDALGVPGAAVEADRVAVVLADRRFGLTLDAPRVTVPEGLLARQGEAVLEIRNLAVRSGRVSMDRADAAITGSIDAPKIAVSGASIGHSGQGAQLGKVSVEGKRLDLQGGAGADAAISGGVDGPKVKLAGASIKGAAESAQLGDVSVEAGRLALQSGPDRFELGLENLRGTFADLKAQRDADGVDVANASIAGEKLSLLRAGARMGVTGSAVRVSVSGVGARQGPDRIALKDASFDLRAMSASASGGSGAPSSLEVRLDDAALRLAALGVVARGAAAELGRVSSAQFGAGSLVLSVPDGPVDATGRGLSATLSDAVVRSPRDGSEMLRLGSAALSGGALRLKDRVVTAEKLALGGGNVKTWLDAGGKFNWLSVFQGKQQAAAPAAATGRAQASSAPEAPAAAWRVALKSAELDGIAVGFEDRRASPVFAVGLEAIRARVERVDTGSKEPMQVDVQAKLASGGQIKAGGQVRADNGASDLKIGAAGIALAPLQTYLSQFAALRLASGTVSTEGRLRYGLSAGTRLAYAGSVAVDRLLLEEIAPKRPFVSWKSVATSDLELTLEPDRLDIGELTIDEPSGRLIIAEDRSVNLKDVLKKPGERKAAEPASAEKREGGDDVFPVSIARVRVSGGTLEFADLSLTPQFATRMHDLKGAISGLGTKADSSARLQLDAQVDAHGSAKIRGQLSVMRPAKLTEVDVAFRNLEMTALSPYVAKFAGYRVASGRLALDLKYKVRDDKLLGENRIVLNQLQLGEKVDSPDALKLPLELAIAILKDSKGVIDIGLPVSGDLSNPKFDTGALIGKAVGNLLGGIATAPFRALGALFGGGEKKLDTIDFEPGSDALAPPERQKLEAVARALKERPALRLVVPPTYAPDVDALALKSQAVRSDIVGRMGIKLKPGEDPGPIDPSNPRVQRAIEAAFSQRHAPEVLAALKRGTVQGSAPTGAPAPAPGVPAATGAPRPPAAAFYQSLVDRLIGEVPVTQAMLAQLAARRGEAIVREVTTAGGAPAARVALGEPHQADAASATAAGESGTAAGEQAVKLRLQLEVAK